MYDVRTLDTNGRTLENWPGIPSERKAIKVAEALANRRNDGAASVIVERVETGYPVLLVALYGDIAPAERCGYTYA
jgi:hypothetical protein